MSQDQSIVMRNERPILNDALRRIAADPAAHRAYLLRASLIESVRRRTAAAA